MKSPANEPNVTYYDEEAAALSSYIFSWNGSGAQCDAWANDSSVTFGGALNWSNASKTIPSACGGKTVGWRVYVTGGSGSTNATSIQSYQAQAPSASEPP